MMNTLTEKIAKKCSVILLLARITRIVLYIILGFTVFMLISTWFSGDEPILKIGDIQVYATVPLRNLFGVDFGADVTQTVPNLRLQLASQLFAYVVSQILLVRIIRLFTLIRDSKDPFTANIARPMKALAILLGLVIAVQNTILGVVVALVIFAFALIFQYGAELQNQVDETI